MATRINYDELINPLTKGMTKAELNHLAETNRKRFYSGIYAPDTVADPDYYREHKKAKASEAEED